MGATTEYRANFEGYLIQVARWLASEFKSVFEVLYRRE